MSIFALLIVTLAPQPAVTYRALGNSAAAAHFSGSVWHEKGSIKRAGLVTVPKAGTKKYSYSILDLEIDCSAWTALPATNTLYDANEKPVSTSVYTAATARAIVAGSSVEAHARVVCGRTTLPTAPIPQGALLKAGLAQLGD